MTKSGPPIGLLLLIAAASCLPDTVRADDWLQFRGNRADAVTSDTDVPVELSGETIQWRSELPGRGLSGPIVVGDRVFLTASSGYQETTLHTLCFDAASGSRLWQRTALATGRTICHPKMAVATPTPASDGLRVFSFYSSNDLVCHDLDGNLQWYRGLGMEYPNASNSLGMSSSPVVIGKTLVVQIESDAEAWAFGLDTATGATKWKRSRPRRANWTSPAVAAGDHAVVILQSSQGLTAVDPNSGDELWTYADGASTIPSASVVGDLVFVPSHGITVLKMSSDRRSFEIAWQKSNLNPSTPSPVAVGNRVYTIGSTALTCADAATGQRLWQLRLKGPFSSTPLAANGHLYLFSEQGVALVVRTGNTSGEIVSQLDLTEAILCTPAIADGAIYVRSDGHLWKLARNNRP